MSWFDWLESVFSPNFVAKDWPNRPPALNNQSVDGSTPQGARVLAAAAEFELAIEDYLATISSEV